MEETSVECRVCGYDEEEDLKRNLISLFFFRRSKGVSERRFKNFMLINKRNIVGNYDRRRLCAIITQQSLKRVVKTLTQHSPIQK
jgi:hypothetical protein